jgi:putative ABC transport system permease protein
MTPWSIAIRTLARRPAFAAAATLTLAVGIAATTTMFSVVDTVLIKALPFPDADRLVTVMETNPAKTSRLSMIAPGRVQEWNTENRTFAAISAWYSENQTDTSTAEPERLAGRRVAPRFFDVYGMTPLAGRLFIPDEERSGGPRAAIVSEAFWARRFNRAADVVGRRLVLGGAGYTIVGVMPAAFSSATTDIWLPAQTPPGLLRIREARFLSGVGRMKAGVTIEQAAADLARVQQALGERYPASDKGWSASVADLKDNRVGEYRRALWLVFGAVALLLAIAVANIAGLLLVQLHRRIREFAIRQALGGSRAQIVGAVMSEILLIATVGSLAGAASAYGLVQLFAKTFATVPRMNELALDARGLAFTVLAAALAALAFGVWPTVHATRGQLTPALAEGGRGASSARHRLQQALVVAQIALSVVLVGSAGLLLRSYRNLAHVDLGFNAENAIAFHVGAAWDEDRTRVGQLQEQLLTELQRMPGVVAAGMTNFLPATGATLRYQITLDGGAPPDDNGKITIGTRTVSGGYLTAMGTSLLAGTWCPPLRVDPKAPQKAMVNRTFAQKYGPDLIGRHLKYDQFGSAQEIVGIVGDVSEDGPAAASAPYVYSCAIAGGWPDPEYVVRTQSDPRAVMVAVREAVHRLDPNRAVFGVRLVNDVVAGALDQPRLNAGLLALFAASAIALASIGLYSLLMLVVAERSREMGVRMALGAAPSHVVRLVLTGTGRLLAAGIASGLALMTGAARLLNTALFGVASLDAATLGLTVAALTAVTLIVSIVPARRAASIDPASILAAGG